MVPVIVFPEVLDAALNVGMLPDPEAPSPILVLLFVHEIVAPGGVEM